jgi:hypothetical protein
LSVDETAADDESHPGIGVAFIANICPEEFGRPPTLEAEHVVTNAAHYFSSG